MQQVLAVFGHFQLFTGRAELLIRNKALLPCDFLRTGNIESLPGLHRLHILRGVQHSLGRSGVQPRNAALHELHMEPAFL